MQDEKVRDRRPISARSSQIAKGVTSFLVAIRATPNAISIASVVFAVGAGLCLLATSSRFAHPAWWFLAPVFIVLRLLANMFDGMVAVKTGTTSDLGELFNEVPDRISDVIIFVCAGFAAGSSPDLGYLAAILALAVAYVRALGNYMRVKKLFIGPMAKSHRMFTLSAFCLFIGFAPALMPDLLAGGLGLISAGSVVTIARRLGRIAAEARA